MKIKILAIPGSLRKDSSNHKVINKITSMLTQDVEFKIYNDIGRLPHFDGEENYELVDDWRNQLQEADGILICTPEYAFGVPGSLKNALDWTVSSGELYDKPLALITASSSGEKGHAALLQTLTALSAKMTEDTKLLIPFIRSKFDTNDELAGDVFNAVRKVLNSLITLSKESKENHE
jgi:NAD(P)H-dependent FMN reductase